MCIYIHSDLCTAAYLLSICVNVNLYRKHLLMCVCMCLCLCMCVDIYPTHISTGM